MCIGLSSTLKQIDECLLRDHDKSNLENFEFDLSDHKSKFGNLKVIPKCYPLHSYVNRIAFSADLT